MSEEIMRPPGTDTDMVVLKNVTKKFKSGKGVITAVDGVSVTIRRGEIFAIIGYSGAGKSTLVRLINGLETVSSGSLSVDGQPVSGQSEAALRRTRQNIGMIFQQFNLMNSRTVAGNVEFPLKVAGQQKQTRRERVRQMLEFVGLWDKAGSYPDQLSGGQKQRVGIARALATSPSLLLADEATSALDPETTSEVLSLLNKVNDELGVTVVVITHEMDVVSSIADRVAVMDSGTIAELGNVYDVFSNPQTEVARRFVATSVKQVPVGQEAAELKKRHRGFLVNVEITEGNNNIGKVLSYLGSYTWIVWFAVFGFEMWGVMGISCATPGIGLQDTHLNVRMGLLTLIIIGEGVIAVTRIVNKTVRPGGWTKWSFVHILGVTSKVVCFRWPLLRAQSLANRRFLLLLVCPMAGIF